MVRTFNNSPIKSIDRRALRRLAHAVLRAHVAGRCDVTITFVAQEEIIALNRTYLGKDSSTDVISFNLGHGPDNARIGDIYICPEVARNNAATYRCTLAAELARLVVHGVLHFAGFDDATAVQKHQMRELEEFYLAKYPPDSSG